MKLAYLTQLTESWCAFFTAFVWRFVIGSNSTIDFFSQAAMSSVLNSSSQRNKTNVNIIQWQHQKIDKKSFEKNSINLLNIQHILYNL